MLSRILSRVFVVVSAFTMLTVQAQGEPDVLILGDSQISYGAGAAYLDFFNNLPQHCEMNQERVELLKKLGQGQTAAIGVRSTSLHSWTAQDGREKGMICDVDEKFGVNAGVYGFQGNNSRQYVQIGEGTDFQFCRPNLSAFENAFRSGYYSPKLLILAFLGNSADRWANNPAAALQDVKDTNSQIPSDIPCIFLTTAPVYLEETNDMRSRAQDVVSDAFARSGGHCKVVTGFSRETRAAIEGNDEYFRQNDAGEVIDNVHPMPEATRMFVNMNMPKLCDAVFSALQ